MTLKCKGDKKEKNNKTWNLAIMLENNKRPVFYSNSYYIVFYRCLLLMLDNLHSDHTTIK